MFLIGTSCNDAALAGILSSVRNIMLLIQIIVPIMLIVWGGLGFFQLMQNPEEKNGIKKIVNKFIAAFVIFMIPVLLNVVMGLAGNNTNFSSCWNNAGNVSTNTSYQDPYDKPSTTKINPDSSDYE